MGRAYCLALLILLRGVTESIRLISLTSLINVLVVVRKRKPHEYPLILQSL
jgi:hypothetical protein